MTKEKYDAEIPRTTRAAWVGLIGLSLLLLPAASLSQTQNQSSPSRAGAGVPCVLTLSNLIVVEVEVRDPSGEHVSNLSHDTFLVYEDGKRQDIDFFHRWRECEDEPSPIKYTIGYCPPPSTNVDWEFRKIRVKVRKSKQLGMSVKYYPEGYFAPPGDW